VYVAPPEPEPVPIAEPVFFAPSENHVYRGARAVCMSRRPSRSRYSLLNPKAAPVNVEPSPEPVSVAPPEPEPVFVAEPEFEQAPEPPARPALPRMPVLPLPPPRPHDAPVLPLPELPAYPVPPQIAFNEQVTAAASMTAPAPVYQQHSLLAPPPDASRGVAAGLRPCGTCQLSLSARAHFCRRCGTAQPN
jgi:hypothetical protein